MLQKLFGFDPARHQVRTEIYAGVTTFLTMAYILAVNPGIFSVLESQGMPAGSVFTAENLWMKWYSPFLKEGQIR